MKERARCILATEALKLTDVDTYYGDSHVLHGVGFALEEKRVLALLGRNGAGKTTCISSIMGFLAPRKGEISLFGTPIGGLAPEAISRLGIGLVPQGRRIHPSLTTREREREAVDIRPHSGSIPELGGAIASTCRLTVRRRAADARYRSRVDRKP